MKRKLFYLAAVIILIALVAFTFFSTVHHGSHCSDIDCEICAQLQSVKKVIESLFAGISLFAVLALPLNVVGIILNSGDNVLGFGNPVRLKDKLSN